MRNWSLAIFVWMDSTFSKVWKKCHPIWHIPSYLRTVYEIKNAFVHFYFLGQEYFSSGNQEEKSRSCFSKRSKVLYFPADCSCLSEVSVKASIYQCIFCKKVQFFFCRKCVFCLIICIKKVSVLQFISVKLLLYWR